MKPRVTPARWGAMAGPAETTALCSRLMCFSRPSSGQETELAVVHHLLAEVGSKALGPTAGMGCRSSLIHPSLVFVTCRSALAAG